MDRDEIIKEWTKPIVINNWKRKLKDKWFWLAVAIGAVLGYLVGKLLVEWVLGW